MKLTFTCIFILCVVTWESQAQVCSDPANVIYGLTDAGNIRPVHVSNAVVDSPYATPPFGEPYLPLSNAMGYDPAYQGFYYFSVENGSQQFTYFSPTGGTLSLDPIPNYSGVVSACVNATGSRFYCLNGGYQLCYYDIYANSWTTLTSDFVDQFGDDVTGNFQSVTGGDMAMDGSGNLWMIIASGTMYALYVISADNLPANAVASVPVIQLIPPSSSSFTNGVSFDGIAFDPSGQIYLSTETDLYLLHTDWSTIDHIGTFNMASSEAMYDLTSCNFPQVALPVTWMNFTASLQTNGDVNLQWQYGEPVDLGTYSIQRSPDCRNWTQIGTQTVENAGAATGYSFSDTNPVTGQCYYRIRLKTPNAPDQYSGIRLVQPHGKTAFTIAPNPVKNSIYIQYSGTEAAGRFEVYDPAGRMLTGNQVSPGANVVSASNLMPGIYIVRVILTDGQVYTQEIVKQ
jgi:hypothetical protein